MKLNPQNRLYHLSVPLIGLTGGIATGKSTVSRILIASQVPLIDADLLVKSIYQEEESREFIKTQFPSAWKNSNIDFKELRSLVFNNLEAKSQVEQFIYARLPAVFNAAYLKLNSPNFVIYDVPLLFEKNMSHVFDEVVLVYAQRKVQTQRLIARDNISVELAEKMLDQQINIEDKKEKSDYLITNEGTLASLDKEVQEFLVKIKEKFKDK